MNLIYVALEIGHLIDWKHTVVFVFEKSFEQII